MRNSMSASSRPAQGSYSWLLRIFRIMKYAVRASAVTIIQLINWNSISTSCEPPYHGIHYVQKPKCGHYKHYRLKRVGKFVLRLAHLLAYFFKGFPYAIQLICDLVHALDCKGEGGASQGHGGQ